MLYCNLKNMPTAWRHLTLASRWPVLLIFCVGYLAVVSGTLFLRFILYMQSPGKGCQSPISPWLCNASSYLHCLKVYVAWTLCNRTSSAETPLPFLSLVLAALAEQTCAVSNLGLLPPLGRLGVKLGPWDGDFEGASFALTFATAASLLQGLTLPWQLPASLHVSVDSKVTAVLPSLAVSCLGHCHAYHPKKRWAVQLWCLKGAGRTGSADWSMSSLSCRPKCSCCALRERVKGFDCRSPSNAYCDASSFSGQGRNKEPHSIEHLWLCCQSHGSKNTATVGIVE